ncbi:MAG TPA: hypothetical protein VJ788_09985 [Gemmatimonadota bacterium]|nr:hypothetical protein [Gemmatimonadota bacterium]
MDTRAFIEKLVPEIAHNATVVRVDERGDLVRVTIAGTTGVEAACEVPWDAVEAANERADARARLATLLKACADRTVAPVPDGRA